MVALSLTLSPRLCIVCAVCTLALLAVLILLSCCLAVLLSCCLVVLLSYLLNIRTGDTIARDPTKIDGFVKNEWLFLPTSRV